MANLRDALYQLRKPLDSFLRIARNEIGLNPAANLWLDAMELENMLAGVRESGDRIDFETSRSLEQAIKLYQGDFLEGFHVRGAPDFEYWLVVERERLRQAVLKALSELVEFHLAQAKYEVGIRYARLSLQLEPLMEASQRQLMRLLAGSGQRGTALAMYQRFKETLNKELGAEPSEETRELYARLLRGEPLPGLPPKRPRHNLSAQSTSFIGREKELAWIAKKLEDPTCRLLTLVGVGGIGKSRLAFQAAGAAVDLYPYGVWQVELAALNQADQVPQVVAAALGVSAQEAGNSRGVIDVLVDYIGDKHLLLILDNCEHLIASSANLAETLLSRCPQLQIMATSRESLRVPGEETYQVPALEIPPEENPPRQLENYAAIRLFVERSKSVRPGFRLTEDNGPSIARICRSLDGLPLAIELAAARVRVLSLIQVAERLQDRFRLLTGGPRTALPRSQTLRASMDWSYSLLSEAERAFLRRLSVFSGNWNLEAAKEVGRFGEVADHSALDLLTLLVDKSLVVVDTHRSTPRYRLLETVRQYGAEKLSEAGETDIIKRRHATFFMQLAEQADPGLRGPEQVEWLERLDLEHDNLRAALAWCIQEKEIDLAYRLLGSLGWFWFMRGHWSEAQKWLSRAIETDKGSNPLFRAKAIYRVLGLEIIRGKLEGNIEPMEAVLATCREYDDQPGAAWCLNILGQVGTWRNEGQELAIRRLSESLELFRQLEDKWGVAWSMRYLGQVAKIKDNYGECIRLQKEAQNIFEAIGDTWNTAHSLYLIGLSRFAHGDHNEAKRAYEECLTKCDIVGDRLMVAHALKGLGELALQAGDVEQAKGLLVDALEGLQSAGDENCSAASSRGLGRAALDNREFDQAREFLETSLLGYRDLGNMSQVALTLGEFAELVDSMGDVPIATRLLAAADAHLKDTDIGSISFFKEKRRIAVAATRKRLGERDFKLAWQEGSVLSIEDAVECALHSASGLA